MTKPSALLSGDPDDVGERLLQIARRERSPDAVRERALSRVAAVSVGAAVATTAKAALAAPALGKSAGLLAVKWLAIGLGAALVTLSAVDQLQRALGSSPGRASPVARVPAERVAPGRARASVVPSVVAVPAADSAAPAVSPVVVAPKLPTPTPNADVPSAGPSAVAFDAPSSAQLTREVAALRQARAALAQGKPGHALETLAAYHREFPIGALGTEEAALRVEIAFAMGDANAFELSRRFLAEHPESPLAARLRALRDAKSASGLKP